MKFTDPMFTDETKAREALEAVRWPDGPYCPHCGNSAQDRIAKVEGKKHSHRPGLYYCNDCKGQITVTVGTLSSVNYSFIYVSGQLTVTPAPSSKLVFTTST